MPTKQRHEAHHDFLDAWAESVQKSRLADIQLLWPHTVDSSYLYYDRELVMSPVGSTDSVRLYIKYPETWGVEVHPSHYSKELVVLRTEFDSLEQALKTLRVFGQYYDTVVIPNMENM